MLFLYQSTRSNVEIEVADRLMLAKRTFADSFANQQRYLINSVETVVNDWALRQVIGQGDKATVESVLVNHSNRVGADVALFIDSDSHLFASTLDDHQDLTASIELLVDSTQATSHRFAAIDGRFYQLVLTEVRAPVPIGWLGMGFVIDDALAERFSRLGDVGVTFIHEKDDEAVVVASSMVDQARASLAAEASSEEREFWSVRTSEWEDLVLHHRLDSGISGLVVVLQKSLDAPLANFQSWWWSLLTIFALIAVSALFFAYLFARGITKPLDQLMVAIKDIALGDYSTPIDVQRSDEIGFLAKAFSQMQTAIAEREAEINYRADYDIATQVYNRAGFLRHLEAKIASAMQTSTPLVVVCFSINHFKEIVDALGHAWGDRLLKQVAERVTSTVGCDSLAHVDVDEFALIFETASVTNAYFVDDQLHRCFVAEFDIRGIALTLFAAVGISVYPEHATDAQSLLRRAGVALNVAVQKRRRTVVYDPDLDQNSVRRLTLMSELPRAIKDDQIELHYQPKLQYVDGEPIVAGVECLARWSHPELGPIPPDDFIGLAERTGHIVELTKDVLRRALEQCCLWRQRGLCLSVAVNISALDLQQAAFANTIESFLDRYSLPPDVLVLEITESAAMQDPASAVMRLQTLSDLGVRLSIDDYGTGYSSLAQLRKMPVQELKIDKSFVLELDRNEDDKTIVRSTIDLAHNIGLEVVAEGIESQRILWQLNKWSCDLLQGFHICRPLPLRELEQWMDTEYPVRRLAVGGDASQTILPEIEPFRRNTRKT